MTNSAENCGSVNDADGMCFWIQNRAVQRRLKFSIFHLNFTADFT